MATIRIDPDQDTGTALQPQGKSVPARAVKCVRNNCCCVIFIGVGLFVFMGLFGGMTGLLIKFNDNIQSVGTSASEAASSLIASTTPLFSLPTRVWRRTVCTLPVPASPYSYPPAPALCGWVDLGSSSTLSYNLTTPASRQAWVLARNVWTGVLTNLTALFPLPGTGTVTSLGNIEATWLAGDSLLYVVLTDGTAASVPVN
jgi:hypothetical protein